jgi:hypothetical protein
MSAPKWCSPYIAVVLGSLMVLPTASAQTRATTADLRILVKDDTGAAVPAATVVVTDEETGLTRTQLTEGDGQAVLRALPSGTLLVRVERDGFMPIDISPFEIGIGTSTDLTVTLQLTGFATVAFVEASSPLVDIQKTMIGTPIDRREIAVLPIDRRNYMSFAVLVPGVATDRTPNAGPAETTGLAIAGQTARGNNITVDGLDNNDDVVGGVGAPISQDAVREFQVIVGSYSAEFGGASAGVVNIATKSGTSQLSGGVFEFFRDKSLNSRGYFDNFDASGARVNRPKAPFRQNQFGGTVGGPLVQNRTFGFASLERLTLDTSATVSIDDRVEVSHPFAPISLGTAAGILARAGFPIETGNVPFPVRTTMALFKVDQVFDNAQRLSIKLHVADRLDGNSQPFGGLVARSRGGELKNRAYVATGSLTSVSSTRVVNELRGQVARYRQVVQSLDPSCGGPCTAFDQGGPAVEIAGVARVGRHNFTPQPRTAMRYEFVDTLSVAFTTHQIKTGLDIGIADIRSAALPLNFGGQFVFADLPAPLAAAFGLPGPVAAIQAFALGLPVAYVRGTGNPSTTAQFQDVSAFVQDEWRANARLIVRIGARYQKQFWPNRAYTAIGYPGSYSPRSGSMDMAPRLGIAWDPRGDGRTAITGAYGLFFGNNFNGPFTTSQIVDGVHVRLAVMQGAPAVAAWQSPRHQLPGALVAAQPSVTISVAPEYGAPYTHQGSVSVNRQMGRGLTLSASALFVNGHRIVSAIDYNPTLPDLGPGRRPEDIGNVAGTSASGLQYTPWGQSWYRGLLFGAMKRAARGSEFLASYSWSRAEDSISDFLSNPPEQQGRGRNPADPAGPPLGFNPSLERGPSLQDQRHRVVLSGIQPLPGNVEVSGIVTVGSGRPYNIIAGADLNRDGDAIASPSPDRARSVPSDPSTAVPRNAGRLPGEARFDLRATKRVNLGSKATWSLTVDVLNVFNTTDFTDINRVFGTGAYPNQPQIGYGQFTQAAPPRQVQIGVRLAY